MNKRIVIYHGGCPDGFCAAWACWRKFGEEDTEYLPWKYGTPPPLVTAETEVVIVDFSFPRDQMIPLIAASGSLVCLDHHKTAEADLAGLRGCFFDMDRSGAAMAWDYFRGDVNPRPVLVDYVQDRDLWRFKLPDSEALSAWVMAQPHTFEAWDALRQDMEMEMELCVERGAAIRMHIAHYCEHMLHDVRIGKVGGVPMPVVNAPMFNVSDLLHELCEKERDKNLSDFDTAVACAWWERGDGMVQHSLRSIGNFDVSEIAKSFGGGGHKNAAGFQASKCVAEFDE